MESFGIQAEQEHITIVSVAQNTVAIALAALFEHGNLIANDLFKYFSHLKV